MKEWFSAAEFADLGLKSIPATRAGIDALSKRDFWTRPDWRGSHWRPRAGRGGGIEYHFCVLDPEVRAALMLKVSAETPPEPRKVVQAQLGHDFAWRRYNAAPDGQKAKARTRLDLVRAVRALEQAGRPRMEALDMVAWQGKVSRNTLYNHLDAVRGEPEGNWLPLLLPGHRGREASADCSDQAWEFIKGDYLRPEQPNLSDCWLRLQETAAVQGWTLPSERTMRRRIKKIDPDLVLLKRKGVDRLKQAYPAQQRDRSMFHALQVVIADGHTWDVRVDFGDGKPCRVTMVAFQDLLSGKVLSWRFSRSESTEVVRLAFRDLCMAYGVPDEVVLDNGRSFASKEFTGGVPNRYRFKIQPDDPVGLMPGLGVKVHFTNPYSGQSKPIERTFRNFAGGIAKHPDFHGAYTGNSTTSKPSNYGSRAVPGDVYFATVNAEIEKYNARPGRTGMGMGGRSFDDVFAASYATAPIRRASASETLLLTLASRPLIVSKRDSTIELAENRYWHDDLRYLRGHKVVVRFDPQALHESVHVFKTTGEYVCEVPCIHAVGFHDVDAARAHAALRNAHIRKTKELAQIEVSLGIEGVAALLPKHQPASPPPEPRVVRLFRGSAALAQQQRLDDEQLDREAAEAARRAFATGSEMRARGELPNLAWDQD